MKHNILKSCTALFLFLSLILILPDFIPGSCLADAAVAAAIKLNSKTISLSVGDTYKLTISGTKSIVQWTSSDEDVAIVSSNGKVVAINEGTADITASVNGKDYICTVIVKEKESNIKVLGNQSIEYEKINQCHRLFFSLQDQNNDCVAADGTVDIRIVNDSGETVYSGSKPISRNNFTNLKGIEYVCSIDIPDSDMITGASSTGIVYFKVYKEENYAFTNNKLLVDNLPYISIVKSCSLLLPNIPFFMFEYNSEGKLVSTIKLDDLLYDKAESIDNKTVDLTLYFTGEKIYDNRSNSNSYTCHIGYKLYKDGYVNRSGIITLQMKVGDKFKNWSETINDLEPGTYNLEIVDIWQ